MNSEKIKNYNQKIIAILGTMLIVGVLFAIIIFIITIIPRTYDMGYTNALMSEEKTEEMAKDSLRKQVISYNHPILVDTINSIYVIQTEVMTLNKAERAVDNSILGLLDTRSNFKSAKYYSNTYYNTFTNLIIHDYKSGKNTIVSDKRMAAYDMTIMRIEDEIAIIFHGAEKDTNKDNIISETDLTSLYIYSLSDRRLRKLSLNNASASSYTYAHNSKDMFVLFTIDKDENGSADHNLEPGVIMRYNYTEDKLTPIIDKDLNIEIQKMINKI